MMMVTGLPGSVTVPETQAHCQAGSMITGQGPGRVRIIIMTQHLEEGQTPSQLNQRAILEAHS
jgi:hypothetical protein